MLASTGTRTLLAAVAAALASIAPVARAQALSLDEALAMAAHQNAELLSATADLEAARADAATARAAVLPRLDLQAAVGREVWGERTTTFDGLRFPQDAGDAGAHSVGLQASQPLFDLSRFRAVEQAGHGVRASARVQEELKLLVAFQVIQRFYELVKQERSLEVLEKTARRSEELVGRADALFAAGRTPRSETFSARVNLGTDRIAVEQQQLRVTQARLSLAQALGWPEPAKLQVAAPPELDGPRPEDAPPALEVLLARAAERRPTLAAENARIAAARAGIGIARAGLYPSLQLQGSYVRSGSELGGRDGVYGDLSRSYVATGQVVLSWNLFEGLGTRAAVRRAEAGLARVEAQAQRSGESVAEEVTGARAAVVALARQEELATENLRVARDALRLAAERFAAGLATQLESRDASLKLSQAELTLLQTRVDRAVARADLARAVGGL